MDLFSLYQHTPYASQPINALMTLIAAMLTRTAAIVSLTPFFGAKVLNKPAKILFAISLVFISLPTQLFNAKPFLFNIDFIPILFNEFFIGMTLGFLASMPFYIAESCGTLIDHQRGASSLQVDDPYLKSKNSPVGVLFNTIGIVIFFWLDGPVLFIQAITRSFEVIPPGTLISREFFSQETPFFKFMVNLMTTEIALAIQLAAPSLVTIFMTDLFLGIANRLAPQVQITFLGLPLKSFLGIFALYLGWFVLVKQWDIEYKAWLHKIDIVVEWLGM